MKSQFEYIFDSKQEVENFICAIELSKNHSMKSNMKSTIHFEYVHGNAIKELFLHMQS